MSPPSRCRHQAESFGQAKLFGQLGDAVEAFIDTCLVAPAAKAVRAEAVHWALFRDLCTKADCRGNLIQDAYLAAMALEHDCTYVTTDGDYARFPGLRWRHPID